MYWESALIVSHPIPSPLIHFITSWLGKWRGIPPRFWLGSELTSGPQKLSNSANNQDLLLRDTAFPDNAPGLLTIVGEYSYRFYLSQFSPSDNRKRSFSCNFQKHLLFLSSLFFPPINIYQPLSRSQAPCWASESQH